MDDLDRILDREDVFVPLLVDEIHHRGHGRGLTAASGARDQDHALVVGGEFRERRGQTELGESRRLGRNAAQHGIEAPLLAVHIGAKTAEARNVAAGVEFAIAEQLETFVFVEDGHHQAFRVLVREHLCVCLRQSAIDPHARRGATVDVNVARPGVARALEQRLQTIQIGRGRREGTETERVGLVARRDAIGGLSAGARRRRGRRGGGRRRSGR